MQAAQRWRLPFLHCFSAVVFIDGFDTTGWRDTDIQEYVYLVYDEYVSLRVRQKGRSVCRSSVNMILNLHGSKLSGGGGGC